MAWAKKEIFYMFEFVTKKEYAPIREEIEAIIKRVQKILKEDDSDQTFQFHLIGSGGRHLITRIKGGNAGYDFDYNLVMNKNFSWKPTIRQSFFDAFQQAIKSTRFTIVENSTSVITIKQVDKKNKKVIVGCDFSVVFYPDDDKSGYYKYARFNKGQQNYTWEIRNVSRFNNHHLNWLKDNYNGIWNDIKEEYLKLKNNNPQGKHSFVLFHESINNIYNQCQQEESYDDENDNY
ncbi:MAG: hypothetical protein ACI311_05735 [Bacilli bacterium]